MFNVDVHKQVMIGCVDFSQYTDSVGNNDMYTKLKNSILIADDYKKQYLIFDDINSTIWIMWYEVNYS